MTELMTNEDGVEPIYDRSKEHLGTTDSMVITVRRILIRAARALRDNQAIPANVDDADLNGVRSVSVVLPKGANWVEETAAARSRFGGVEVAYVTPT